MKPDSKRSTRRRDYKAEYQRRIERGLARGLTRSQARGHGTTKPERTGPGSAYESRARVLEKGLKSMRQGSSLLSASRELHVAPETLRRYIISSGMAHKRGARWRIAPDNRTRRMPVFSDGRELKVWVDTHVASLIGSYMNDVGRFLNTNDIQHLSPWNGRTFTDIKGRNRVFESRPNILYRLNLAGRTTFEQIYRIAI